jgi:acyl dehydratase
MTDELLYFEDFPPGLVMDLGEVAVSADEIVAFARAFDPQPFHTDPEAAAASPFGGLIASGWHTCALLMRRMCDGYLLRSASLGSPGVDEIRWLRPVRPGDTLRATMTVTGQRPSASKPDRGVVRARYEVTNQDGATVMTMEAMSLFKRKGG